MTVPEIKAQIVAWIKTGIPNNVKSSNMRTLLNWITLRMDVQEVGRLKITKTTGNVSPELQVGDKVSGIVEDTHIVNAIYLGGNSNLLASYEIDTSSNKVDKGGNEIDTGFSLRESIDSNFQNFDNYIPTSQKGSANGVPETDANNIILTQHLPSYVDDVIDGTYVNTTTFKNLSGTTLTPENGKIYIDTTTNKSYRWSGSVYVLLTGGIVLGETASTAYRGDRGKQAYDHSLKTTGNPHNVTAAQIGAETPAGAQTKANTAETNAKNYADTLDSNRTVIKKNNNTYFDAVAQNFSKDLLEFTADLGEVIEVRITKDLVLSGGLQAISTGNNQLKPIGGTDVTLIFPEGAGVRTIPKGLLSILATGTPNVYKIDGSLESTNDAPQVGASKPIKTILNTSQYTFELEDKDFFLVFPNALANCYVPGQVFSPSDELQGTFKISDVTISSAENPATASPYYALLYPTLVRNIFAKRGTFGLKFISETEVSLVGHQKPA